jgi:hypothetical protein
MCRMTRRTPSRHAGIGSPGSILQPVRAQQRAGSVCAKLRGRGNLPKPPRYNCRRPKYGAAGKSQCNKFAGREISSRISGVARKGAGLSRSVLRRQISCAGGIEHIEKRAIPKVLIIFFAALAPHWVYQVPIAPPGEGVPAHCGCNVRIPAKARQSGTPAAASRRQSDYLFNRCSTLLSSSPPARPSARFTPNLRAGALISAPSAMHRDLDWRLLSDGRATFAVPTRVGCRKILGPISSAPAAARGGFPGDRPESAKSCDSPAGSSRTSTPLVKKSISDVADDSTALPSDECASASCRFFGNIKGLPRLFVPILFEHRDMMYANSLELPLAL